MTRFTVYVTPGALEEIKDLPGNIRQRVKRAISELEKSDAPSNSKSLDPSEVADQIEPDQTIRRIRMDRWRIVYRFPNPRKS